MFSLHRVIDGQYYVWTKNPLPGVEEGWETCGPAFSTASDGLGYDVQETYGAADVIFFFSDLQACQTKAKAISVRLPLCPSAWMSNLKAGLANPIESIEIWEDWGDTSRRRRVLCPIG